MHPSDRRTVPRRSPEARDLHASTTEVPLPRHTSKSPKLSSVRQLNHSGHSSPGWRPSAIEIRSTVSLRMDRLARMRCSVLRSIRSSSARPVPVWSRRRAQRRNSATSGVASYHPPWRRRTDSATASRPSTRGLRGHPLSLLNPGRHRWPCAAKKLKKRLCGNLDQPAKSQNRRRPLLFGHQSVRRRASKTQYGRCLRKIQHRRRATESSRRLYERLGIGPTEPSLQEPPTL